MPITPAQGYASSTEDLERLYLLSVTGMTSGSNQDLWAALAPSGKRAWALTSASLPVESALSEADAFVKLLDVLTSAGRAWATGSLPDRWRSYMFWAATTQLP